jgi:long-chain acyl-CoA synthetase
MQLNRFLEDSARRLPDKTALLCQGRRWSYGELNAGSERMAAWLQAQGLTHGDRVGIFLENSAEAVVAIFAALKAGAVFSVHHPGMKPARLQSVLGDSGARILITDASRAETLTGVLDALPGLERLVVIGPGSPGQAGQTPCTPWAEALDSRAAGVTSRGIDLDLAAIIYTSGTTGQPKGVMLTHRNMTSAADSVIEYLENTEQDVILDVLPLSFSYGLHQVLTAFRVGATVVLERSFLYPYPVIDLMLKERVTGFPLVPTIAALLMQLKDLARFDFSSVRYVTSAAQAISPRQIQALRDIFPRAKFYSMYGQTECKRISYLPPEEIERRPTSVGKAIPNTETYLADEAGRPFHEPGRTGELVVRGSHVMPGYWNLPAETAKKLKPGSLPWERHLFTGDLFKMDDEGFLYFVSRKDDLIKTGGELVSPKEVEDVLCGLPEVAEAAVTGRPDDLLGQTIAAFVVLQTGTTLTEAELLLFCKQRLESFKVPKTVRILTELPKTPTGKINKREL